MTHSEALSHWIEELDRLSSKASQCTLTELPALLDQRQQILTQIQTVDMGSLDDDFSHEIATRLKAIQERDDVFVVFLGTVRKNVEDALDMITQARTTMRGYRAQQPTLSSSFDETA
jgi:hypothetical protein